MIVVVGSLNMDIVVRVERLPVPGETVLGEDYECHPGGKGANQAIAAARLGGKVRLVGRVGTDVFGQQLCSQLESAHVETAWLETVSGPSGVALVTVDKAGQNTIVVSPGANAKLKPEDLFEQVFDGVDLLLTQLEVPLETVKRATDLAKQAGALVVLNAAPARTLAKDLLRNVDLLLVNEIEAGAILGVSPPCNLEESYLVAQALAKWVPWVIVTLGSQGVVWAIDGKLGHQPAFPVKVVDATAAGDAFAGALAVGLAEGRSLEEVILFATAAGALTVTRKGAQPSLPTRDEVEEFLRGRR